MSPAGLATIRMQMGDVPLRCYSGLLTYHRDEHPIPASAVGSQAELRIYHQQHHGLVTPSTEYAAALGSAGHMGDSSRVRGRRKQK